MNKNPFQQDDIMKTTLVSLSCACGLTLMASNEILPISTNSKNWHIGGKVPGCELSTINVEYEGKTVPALRMTFSKTATYVEARLSLTKTIDISSFTRLNLEMNVDPVAFEKGYGQLALRSADWKQENFSFFNGGGVTRINPGQWHPLSVDVTLSRAILNRRELRQIALAFRPRKMLEGSDADHVTVTILDMAFVKTSDPAYDEKMAKWEEYIKNYKPDYGDGSHFLEPPTTGRLEKPLPIVEDGEPAAEIIVNRLEDEVCAVTAAEELRHWIQAITGTKLQIRDKATNKKNTKIFIGKRVREIAGKPYLFGDDLAYLSDSDGFAIRNIDNKLYVFGTEGKGALNGVYALLENNTDIIWPRPHPDLNAVFSEKKDLDFVWGDHRERPASRSRGWNGYRDLEWMARNKCNGFYGGAGGDIAWMNKKKEKWGGHLVRHLYGHNIGHFLYSKKYFKTNPEYYSLVNGERKPWRQYCFSNEEMTNEFIWNVLDIARRAPKKSDMLSIAMDDTWEACECPNCMKSIKLPDGTILENNDPAFRSTQYFRFLNKVADALHREFPHLQLCTQAYFSTATPPQVELHPAIRIEFAPYVRVNDKTPLFSRENKIWLERLSEWKRKVKDVDIYGYHGLGMSFPRPMGEVRAWDFREMYDLGVQGVQSEYYHRGDLPKGDDKTIAMWDVSAMEFWLMCRLGWNPDQDVEGLRKYFINRVFREAAPPMERFYGTLRSEWFKDPIPSTLGADPVGCAKHYIIDKGLEGEMRGFLEEAERAAVHPVSKPLVKRIRRRFEDWISKAKAIKTPTLSVPLIREAATVDFDNPLWTNAAEIDGLKKMHAPDRNSKCLTKVKLFHDAENLYVYFQGFDDEVGETSTVVPQKGKEVFPECDHVEIFIGDQSRQGAYFMFVFDPNGYTCELEGYESAWNGDWECVTRTTADGWEGIATIPFATINFNLGKDHKLKALVMREFHHGDSKLREYSSWGGGKVHDPGQFGTLLLMR